MRLIINLLFLSLVAGVLGLGLTALAVRHPPMLDAIRSGPWAALASEGTAQIDAYALAGIAARGEVPMSVADGLSFRSNRDDDGALLNGKCTYLLQGAIPTVRAWTLAAYDADGTSFANPAQRFAFSSGEITRGPDGAVSILISPEAQPGNWLPVAKDREFMLMLRLYDTTAGAISGGRSAPDLPSIKRVRCSA